MAVMGKIISGGQTEADRGFVFFVVARSAKHNGLKTFVRNSRRIVLSLCKRENGLAR